jgi:hypothetical protein
VRVDELLVEITDGGDAPLDVTRVAVEVETADLYLAAPEGSYRLLVGNAEAEPPRYEIARARGLALSVPADEVPEAPLGANPDWVPTRSVLELAEIALWAVLGLAVLFLAWLSLRLARAEGANDEGGGDPAPPSDTPPDAPDDTPDVKTA